MPREGAKEFSGGSFRVIFPGTKKLCSGFLDDFCELVAVRVPDLFSKTMCCPCSEG